MAFRARGAQSIKIFVGVLLPKRYRILSKNNNNLKKFLFLLQSARNFTRSSETIRQLSNQQEEYFNNWFAGVIDGDGNFDVRKNNKFKCFRIKLHNRDIRILTRIQNFLHIGKIKNVKKKPYALYIVSNKEDLLKIVHRVNGKIRLKVYSFRKVCEIFNIEFKSSNYTLSPMDPYFAGLIDTDGSIVFNYNCNRIECNLELKHNEYSSKLDLDWVIPNTRPNISLQKKKNQQSIGSKKTFKSIAFKFQSVNGMIPVYDYFMKNRLYSDFKFYRVSRIKGFVEIRNFSASRVAFDSEEFKIYSNFLLNFIQHLNPSWTKTPFLRYLNIG